MVAPFGALSPRVYLVPSGAIVAFPSASVKVGASVVTEVPAFPTASLYAGVSLSASVAGAALSVYLAVKSTFPFNAVV